MKVETVPHSLIFPERGKIEEIRVGLSLETNDFSRFKLCRSLDIGGPHTASYRIRGVVRSNTLSGIELLANSDA